MHKKPYNLQRIWLLKGRYLGSWFSDEKLSKWGLNLEAKISKLHKHQVQLLVHLSSSFIIRFDQHVSTLCKVRTDEELVPCHKLMHVSRLDEYV